MAKLIKCSDCRKKISVNANACPNCGAPVQQSADNDRRISGNRKTALGYVLGAFFIVSGLGAFTTGFLPAILLIAGGILALPVARRVLIDRNFSNSHTPFVIASAILIIFGTIMLNSKKQENHLKYIEENPEAYAAEQAETAKRDAERQAQDVAKKEGRKTSEATLLSLCQINVKNSMKNPKSFDMNYSSKQLSTTTDGYAIKFSYTGTNSFNATITSVASCSFDKDGRLLSISST